MVAQMFASTLGRARNFSKSHSSLYIGELGNMQKYEVNMKEYVVNMKEYVGYMRKYA